MIQAIWEVFVVFYSLSKSCILQWTSVCFVCLAKATIMMLQHPNCMVQIVTWISDFIFNFAVMMLERKYVVLLTCFSVTHERRMRIVISCLLIF